MNLTQRLKIATGALFGKSTVFGLTDAGAWAGRWITFGGNAISVEELTQLQTNATWSALRLITESIGAMPLKFYHRTASGRELAHEHDIAQLMRGMPNEYMTSQDVIESIVISLACTGQSYSQIDRFGTTGRVVGVTPLRKNRVIAGFDQQTGRPKWQQLDPLGQRHDVNRRDICPIRGFGGPESLEGYAPHELQRSSLAITKAAEDYAEKYFANGARPPHGYLSTDLALKGENREEIRASYGKQVSESFENGKLPILEHGIRFQPISSSAQESQLNETRKQQVAEAARIYRVPLSFLFEGGNETYANREQATIQLLNHCLIPYMRRIEKGLTINLLSERDAKDFYFEFDVRGLLRGDNKTRAQYYKDMRIAGAITANEIRDSENLPRDASKEADQLWMPLNMAPGERVMSILDHNSESE